MTAYKGLLKEKEAVDASFSALSISKPADNAASAVTPAITTSTSGNASTFNEPSGQLATLMNSLATLSAEKSRMEASFQADKRNLRQEMLAKDGHIKDLQLKVKAATSQSSLELEKVKSKLIVERHARDKEINDHMIMVKELQKLLSDERQLKENFEMQLNNLKSQFSQLDNTDGRVKELISELDQTKRKLKEANKKAAHSSSSSSSANNSGSESSAGILKQLQSEMSVMRQQHAVAIQNEQRRAMLAEDRSKKLAAAHEDRVANLESRLAELSSTVGTYDRLRQTDQDSIFKLKDKIAQLQSTSDAEIVAASDSTPVADKDINMLVEEIGLLKKQLLIENAKQATPQDLSKIFSSGNDHSDCVEEYEKLNLEYQQYRKDNEAHNNTVDVQKTHIRTLQDKIQVLNRNIDEQEQELKTKSTEHFAELKTERGKLKELIASMEMDFRGKLSELEHQLQRQRERSLTLLEEKENEIKTLKTSFELFIPGGGGTAVISSGFDNVSDEENRGQQRKISKLGASHLNVVLGPSTSGTANASGSNTSDCHMLHYVHELSRKEVEITGLRKAKHAAESSLRQALQDKVTSQQELHDRIGNLEDNVDR